MTNSLWSRILRRVPSLTSAVADERSSISAQITDRQGRIVAINAQLDADIAAERQRFDAAQATLAGLREQERELQAAILKANFDATQSGSGRIEQLQRDARREVNAIQQEIAALEADLQVLVL